MIKKFIALGLIAISLALAVIMNVLKPVPEKLETPEAAIAVKTKILQRSDTHLSVESQGTVMARTRTLLTSEVSGTIREVSERFVSGGIFRKGETLMQIDTSDYDVALQRAEAQVVSRRAALEFEKARRYQAKKEWAMTGKSEEEAPPLALRTPFLSEAKARLLEAEAELKRAKFKLQRTKIQAPYSGMVSKKMADVGQYVTQGTQLGEMFSTDVVEVRLPLTEKDLSMMDDLSQFTKTPYNKIVLEGSINGSTNRWFAELVRSEGVVNEDNRSQYAVASVADPYRLDDPENSPPLLVGTFVRAIIPGRILHNVFKVPRSGVLEGPLVATVNSQQRLALKPVEILFADELYHYVSKGLSDGEEVIISAIGTPIEGLRVEVKNTLLTENIE